MLKSATYTVWLYTVVDCGWILYVCEALYSMGQKISGSQIPLSVVQEGFGVADTQWGDPQRMFGKWR